MVTTFLPATCVMTGIRSLRVSALTEPCQFCRDLRALRAPIPRTTTLLARVGPDPDVAEDEDVD